jgi:hypothetical protein
MQTGAKQRAPTFATKPVVRHQIILTELVAADGSSQVQLNTGNTIGQDNMSELLRLLGFALGAASQGLAAAEAQRVNIATESDVPAPMLHTG